MALSLSRFWRRRGGIAPMRQRDLGPAPRGVPLDDIEPLSDDYLVEGDETPYQPSAVAQTAQLLQVVLIAIMAVVSLAVFWIAAQLLNIL